TGVRGRGVAPGPGPGGFALLSLWVAPGWGGADAIPVAGKAPPAEASAASRPRAPTSAGWTSGVGPSPRAVRNVRRECGMACSSAGWREPGSLDLFERILSISGPGFQRENR